MKSHWQYWIDVGGTFTDCIAQNPDRERLTTKVLSSGIVKGTAHKGSSGSTILFQSDKSLPEDFFQGYTFRLLNVAGEAQAERQVQHSAPGQLELSEPLEQSEVSGHSFELTAGEASPLLGIRMLRGLRLDEPIGHCDIRLGTTRGTNALLERKGAPTALAITAGFGDLPHIGTQARPKLFELNIRKPEVLHRQVVVVQERISAKGEVLRSLDEEQALHQLHKARESGCTSLAIALLNAYANPQHEERLAELAPKAGFSHISVSTRLSRTIKLLDRMDTTLLDAYLTPVIRQHLEELQERAPEAEIRIMTSAGGLVPVEEFRGKDSLLSGPAGGVTGFAHVALQAGFSRAIGFDMGGTSTDVSRYSGRFEYEFRGEKAGVRVVSPAFAIETVAAGGGSICAFDGQKLTVGPESAGAEPGPACYGRGGPLTVTDVNLFLGRTLSQHFPFRLDEQAVETRLKEVQQQLKEASGRKMSLHELAEGFRHIANSRMAEAIKRISTAKGYDPREHVLVSFGGAGAQHACAIARILGMRKVLLHPLAGILSAYGMGVASEKTYREQSVLQPLDNGGMEQVKQVRQQLTQELERNGYTQHTLLLDLRYVGEDSTITIRERDRASFKAAFEAQHQQLYGHRHEAREIEVVNVRVEGVREREELPSEATPSAQAPKPEHEAAADAETERVVYRKSLRPGQRLKGPKVILEELSTIVLDEGWEAELTEQGNLLLTDQEESRQGQQISTERDPVYLELFNNHFTHIAQQMGLTLQKIALSVNVKERLDFSCALLDAQGRLIVNAPHIPVHLGAISACVQDLLEAVPAIRPGDAFLTNDPHAGGTHLPDLTVITPVFDEAGQELRFFTASRAHHSEIGGIKPGSTFPFAQSLAEEGVVFRHFRLVRTGELQEEALREQLTSARYPSRSPDENVADIKAQLAANNVGVRELQQAIRQYTWPVVQAYMGHIREVARERVQAVLKDLQLGTYTFSDQTDDGAPIHLQVEVEPQRIRFDFSGTAPVQPNSLNATPAIVRSCVLYCLRCLVPGQMPLNDGMLEPVELVLPEGMLHPPAHSDPQQQAAVVGGNTELSQKVVDVIFGALGVVAASQGTMNNFVFGNKRFGYYETIGGGAGAGETFAGASAVHSHMTNTHITDTEVLEQRYPVRLLRFSIKKGSGGTGKNTGGSGIIRHFQFLQAVEASLLTQRRRTQPYGLKGGATGTPGRNLLRRKGEDLWQELEPLAQLELQPGDEIIIETPGGGGWGERPG